MNKKSVLCQMTQQYNALNNKYKLLGLFVDLSIFKIMCHNKK